MASGGQNGTDNNLVKVGTLRLKPDDLNPSGIVVVGDKLVITDRESFKVHVYRRHDGMLLSSSDRLESRPWGVSSVNDTDLCVVMWHGIITLMSVLDSGLISRGTTFHLTPSFDYCTGVASFRDNVVVSGAKDNTIYWCVVSIQDGRHDNLHKVCGGTLSWMTTKENMAYFSCNAKSPDDRGVYGFNLLNPSQTPYRYKGLYPHGIIVDDNGYLFVCDWNSIHHLTEKCELVAIFKEEIPRRAHVIFWDRGILYLTAYRSNVISMYETPHQGKVIPIEILNMDDRSIQLFENALKDGKEKVYSIRVMVVGHLGVGKTTLIKRLLGKDVNISERHSTEDSEQDYRLQRLAKVLIEKQPVWRGAADEKQVVITPKGDISDINARDHADEEPYHDSPQNDVLKTEPSTTSQQVEFSSSVEQRNFPKSDSNAMVRSEPGDNVPSASQQVEFPSSVEQRNLPKSVANAMVKSESGENVSSAIPMKDPNREFLQLLQENADTIKHDLGKYAPLTMWDFAGQYAFYTTHQMFLSRRAIYLLVSDISGHVDDLVEDECFFDRKGIMKCKVHELVEVWLNSIHSCAPADKENNNCHSPSYNVIPPPVILVGTHVDAIPQAEKEEQMKQVLTAASEPAISKNEPTFLKRVIGIFTKIGAEARKVKWHMQVAAKEELDELQINVYFEKKKSMFIVPLKSLHAPNYRHDVCESYFKEIRSHLKDKPSRLHLVQEDFAIDNSVVDSKLKDLKKKIVEVATQQPFWGEEVPARWLLLEQALMNFRAQGLKVIPRSLLVNLNEAGGVQISTDELDLFLRFQHEIGTILYFSTELLKEKIVLEPQLMINALKSLITAEMFVLRNNPLVSAMWFEFKDGKLHQELIDALWTKDKNADLHDNKEHILLLMEQLNIIAKPTIYIDDASEIKEVNYFFAPCMINAEPPREVICPETHPQMESSSVMCYVFTGKFLPAPIFHRLLAACVAYWPLATKKTETTLKNQIFCGCGVFQLDHYHKLTLHFWDYIISMRVTRQGIKDKTPSSKLCIKVKEFVATILNKIIGYLGHSLKFEEFIQCPEYNGESVNSLIPVSLLKENAEVRCDFHNNIIESNTFLKFWFENQEQQEAEQRESSGSEKDQEGQGQDAPDAPITQEHINHARLCNALTTVCADALREILISQVPVTYASISQAILANKTNLTSKKLLNKNQRDVVFPDIKCRFTGTVDQFDTSLLYTLIRNVSSVPSPTSGWGNPPVDQPTRDTSLGASVERIRLFRNEVSGHSVDGKISDIEFKDYWQKIDNVLTDIESAIGVRDYRVQLEKRKSQAITPHEARHLQRQFQEYKKQVEDAKEKLRIAMEAVEKL